MQVRLRPWQIDELDTLVAYANDIGIARWMTDGFPHPYGPDHGRAFMDFANRDTPQRIFAIEYEGKPVGSIGLHPRSDIERYNMELGYWLARDFWGRGIITEAIRQVVDYGFAHFDITRIFARPFGPNIASQKALEKAGFRLEARFEKTFFKNGEAVDECVYGARRAG